MKVHFYLADDVKQMPHGKVLIVGAYTDHTVIVHVRPKKGEEEKPAAIESISMLLAISGLEAGEYECEPVLVFPSGVERNMRSDHPFVFSVEPDRAINLIFNYRPLLTPEDGTYRFELRHGGKALISADFFVRLSYEQTDVVH